MKNFINPGGTKKEYPPMFCLVRKIINQSIRKIVKKSVYVPCISLGITSNFLSQSLPQKKSPSPLSCKKLNPGNIYL